MGRPVRKYQSIRADKKPTYPPMTAINRPASHALSLNWSGRGDLNSRPPAPKEGEPDGSQRVAIDYGGSLPMW